MCVCVCERVCERECVCMCACVGVCVVVRVSEHASACVRVGGTPWLCVFMCVTVDV